MKTLFIILAGVVMTIGMVSCQKEVLIFEEKFTDQKVDTVNGSTLYITRGNKFDRSLLPIQYDMNFTPFTVAINGTTLFAANPAGRRVDMFDTKAVTYLGNIFDGTTSNISVMVPRGIAATDQYIFIAASETPASQVYVYDRRKLTYFGRLGTGQPDVLNGPFSVIVHGKYAFVRDLGKQIKVFNIDNLAQGQSLQPFCYIETPYEITEQGKQFDMQVVGNMLMVIHAPNMVLTCYNLNNITSNTPETPMRPMANISTDPNVPQSIIADNRFCYLAAVPLSGQPSIQLLSLQDLNELIYRPVITFYQAGEYKFRDMTSLCVLNETLYMTQDKSRIESVNIKLAPVEIYHPQPLPKE